MSTCFFIGHRDAPESLFPQLSEQVERHASEYGVTTFVVGQYGQFDALAARAVREAKRKRPELALLLLRPYHPFDRPGALPSGFDGTMYPPGMETVPQRAAILRANRYMADHCDYMIAYACRSFGNAAKLVDGARRREAQGTLKITLLSPA